MTAYLFWSHVLDKVYTHRVLPVQESAYLAGSDEVQYLIPQDILGTDDSLPTLV